VIGSTSATIQSKPPGNLPFSGNPTCGWTSWMNGHSPSGSSEGDEESLTSLRKDFTFCPTSDITAIECRDVATGKTATQMGQVNVICDTNYSGLKCFNNDQPDGKCLDYEVRFLCEPKDANCKPTTQLSRSTTIKPTVASPTTACVSGWSNWINENGDADGDHEQMTEEELRNLCPGGIVTDIDCVTDDNGPEDDWVSVGEATCDLQDGLSCTSLPFPGVPGCRNYKIRYMCNCSASAGHLVQKRSANEKRNSNIPDECLHDMGMKSGHVRNNMVSASSYRDSHHAPQKARLDSSSCWLAATNDKDQYIEVDFLKAVHLTGLTTQGRPDAPSFVTSYTVEHSTDGKHWSPYREETGLDKIFKANSDSHTSVTATFQHPVLARLLRVRPITWQGRIAMRFEVHGCSTVYPLNAPLRLAAKDDSPSASPDEECVEWGDWQDMSQPSINNKDDIELIEDLVEGSSSCQDPVVIECRTATPDHIPAKLSGQNVTCSLWDGLRCTASDVSICYNYEVRLGCWKPTSTCMLQRASPVKTELETSLCYPNMDSSHCPHCAHGLFCDGHRCVPKNECPCSVDDNVIRPGAVVQNMHCETCQCLGGELICMAKVCPACPVGQPQLEADSCSCKCETCSTEEFQCATGLCISSHRRCDGVIDCADDELNCENPTAFVSAKTKGQTMCNYTTVDADILLKQVGDIWQDGPCVSCSCKWTAYGVADAICNKDSKCVAGGCHVNDVVYKVGQLVPGNEHKCQTSTCQYDAVKENFFIQHRQIECPKPNALKHCADESDVFDSDGCCMKCIPHSVVPLFH